MAARCAGFRPASGIVVPPVKGHRRGGYPGRLAAARQLAPGRFAARAGKLTIPPLCKVASLWRNVEMTDIVPVAPEEKKTPLHEDEEFHRLYKFIEDFDKESDRAVVILGAARVDQLLGELLRALLIPSPSSKDELFEADGPLGTFSSRIALGYRIGLLNTKFAQSLTMLRKCRNAFAHQVTGCSMQDGSEADRVREFVRIFRKQPMYETMRGVAAKSHTGLSAEFRASLGYIIVVLEQATLNREPIAIEPIGFL